MKKPKPSKPVKSQFDVKPVSQPKPSLNSQPLIDKAGPIQNVKLALIEPSPFNARVNSGFDEDSIRQLANSIVIHGILNPLLCRPSPKTRGHFELIAGERRFQASHVAGRADAPIRSGEFSDADVIELQTVENLQRENLHELEEAKNYEQMLKLTEGGVKRYPTVEAVADRVKVHKNTIYARLKLLQAPPIARQAFMAHELSASTMLLIARIPDPKLADKAARECLNKHGKGTDADDYLLPKNLEDAPVRRSYRDAKKHIQETYMIRLKAAPFNQEDADLVPVDPKAPDRGGGACGACPFRSGNILPSAPDLISGSSRYGREFEAGAADVCTNTPCFRRKKDAAFRQEAGKAREMGNVLLKPAAGAKLFHHDGRLGSDQYIELSAPFPGQEKKKNPQTWEEALGEHLPDKLTHARDERKKLHILLPIEDAITAAKAAGHTVKKPEPRSQGYDSAADDKKRAEWEVEKKFLRQVAGNDIIPKLEAAILKTKPDSLGLWQFLAKHITDRGEKTVPDCLLAILAEKFRFSDIDLTVRYNCEFDEAFVAICKFYKIDRAAIVKTARDAQAKAVKPEPKAAK